MKKIIFFLFFCCSVALWGQRIRVACVGNSVTAGYLLKEPAKESYPAQLQTLLGDQYEVRNFGHSGATLLSRGHRPYILTEEFRQAMDFKADKVVIHLGLNDTDPRNWNNYRDEFIPNYIALIDSFKKANPKAEIFVCRMTPIFDSHRRFSSGTLTWHKQVQEAIERVYRTTLAHPIDLFAPLHNRPDLFPDALHPTTEGAGIIAKTVYTALTKDNGGLQLSPLYGEGMVVQQGNYCDFKGKANPKEVVTVQFGREKQNVATDDFGNWEVTLNCPPAGGPYKLTISTNNRKIEIKKAYVGEVWLCSGQSNMAFELSQTATAKTDIAQAKNYGNIHLFNMRPRWLTEPKAWELSALDSVNRLNYFQLSGWQTCTSQTAADFSAVAYHFARHLSDSLKVPIGIICNAVGGSNTESWIDRRTLEEEIPAILKDFPTSDYIMDWCRQRAALNTSLNKSPLQRHPYNPAYLFEAGIEPLMGYRLAGVAWYQGESNAHNVELHKELFPMLVKSWRKTLGENFSYNLPFLYVQLSSIGTRPSWPQFRYSQLELASRRESRYMVVSSDLGDSLDVHPRTKAPIGERLARQALNNVYGHKEVECQGPVPYEAFMSNSNTIVVRFRHAKGLQCTQGFEVANHDRVFRPAKVLKIEGNTITLSTPPLNSSDIMLRYGWQPFTRGDLRNGAGLPASTFEAEVEVMFISAISN
ncbi:MAG: GDSL-type esterase/lipase family protein [Alloprevotella sp.]|nr:GDSL-type esterase/lipase family protein [Alloprevotella sp.]